MVPTWIVGARSGSLGESSMTGSAMTMFGASILAGTGSSRFTMTQKMLSSLICRSSGGEMFVFEVALGCGTAPHMAFHCRQAGNSLTTSPGPQEESMQSVEQMGG